MNDSPNHPTQGTTEAALRFGLIGCGDIGRLRADALRKTPGCRLTAVADVDPRKAQEVAGTSGAAALADWRDLVRRPDVDAVIVSTPPHLHAEMTIAALDQGKHVLCEKPLARTLQECRAMVAAAERSGRRLATGFNYRFYPSFALAKRLVDEGAIGRLNHIRSYGGYSATGHNQPWVHDAGTVGGGALRDIGIHLIDLTRDLLGEVREVQGVATGNAWQFPGCEDNGFALLRGDDGRVASVHASWTEWKRYQFRVEAYGSHGCIRATCFPMTLQVVTSDGPGTRTRSRTNLFPASAVGEKLFSYRWVVVQSFVQEHLDFLRYLRGEPSRVATGLDGLRALEIAEQATATFAAGAARAAEEAKVAERATAVAKASAPVAVAGASGTSRPALSVVVVMFTSVPHLQRCLDALRAQQKAVDAEILVPHDDSWPAAEVAAAYPSIRFLHRPGIRTPAELRAYATAASRGSIVAFLEDHCVPADDWCAAVIRGHERPHAAVGGPVDKGVPPGRADDTALNWAVYLTDYSRYMPPMPEGPAHSLTDCNVSYKRSALDALADAWRVELHENVVNGLLVQRGEALWLDPAMVVFEQRDLTIRSALRDRLSFGRLFGSTRSEGAPLVRRLTYGAAAILMPPVLTARVAGNLRRRGRHQQQFVRCLPHLLLLSGTWMLGEAIGYVTGTRGRALTASTGSGKGEKGLAPGAAE